MSYNIIRFNKIMKKPIDLVRKKLDKYPISSLTAYDQLYI